MSKTYVVEITKIGDTGRTSYYLGGDEKAYIVQGAQQFSSRREAWKNALDHMNTFVDSAYSRFESLSVVPYPQG